MWLAAGPSGLLDKQIAYENPQIENPHIENPQSFANPLKIPMEGIENPHKFKHFKYEEKV